MSQLKIVSTLLLYLLISGCGGSNNPPVDPPAEMNTLSILSEVGADEDADGITDNEALQMDITSLFGGPDSQPVEVEPGDTLADVIARAGT